MVSFRQYIQTHLNEEDLQVHAIDDLTAFDYRQFLLAQGITDQQYRAQILAFPSVIPLAKEYLTISGGKSPICSTNSSAMPRNLAMMFPMSSNSPYYWAEFMHAVDAHDFYTNEMEYQAPEIEVLPTEPIYTFKLADALNRLVAITGIPCAFEPCRVNDRPGHIRLWIAQAYAFGHVFMAPV